MIIYNSRHIIQRPAWITYKRWVIDIALFIGVVLLIGLVPMNTDSFVSIILWCIPVSIFVVAIYFAVAFIFEPTIAKEMFKMAKGIFTKKKKTNTVSGS